MKHLISTQSLAAIALTLGAFAVASSAHARTDVTFSVGVQVPGVSVHYRPIYRPMPRHFGRYDDGRRYGGSRNQWRQTRLYGPYGDLDRDGVRNRWDRDVDGDGVRNRYDRFQNNPNRR